MITGLFLRTGFVDGLLDLIVDDPEVKKNVVDYLGKAEYLYLGPDEQIIPEVRLYSPNYIVIV